MRRRGQLVTGLQEMVGQRVDKAINGLIKTGEIVRIGGRTAYVKIDGSVGIKPAELFIDAEPGDLCVLTRPSEQHRWKVTGKLNPNAQPVPEDRPSSFGELSPPGSFQAFTGIGGCCAWTWSTPAQKPVAFELQYNTSASDSGASTSGLTRGSYFIISSEVTMYARIRSVGPHYQKSAWSAWVECEPGAGSGGGGGGSGGSSLIYVIVEQPVIDNAVSGSILGSGIGTLSPSGFSVGDMLRLKVVGEIYTGDPVGGDGNGAFGVWFRGTESTAMRGTFAMDADGDYLFRIDMTFRVEDTNGVEPILSVFYELLVCDFVTGDVVLRKQRTSWGTGHTDGGALDFDLTFTFPAASAANECYTYEVMFERLSAPSA